MSNTPNLALAYIASSQAQKEVTLMTLRRRMYAFSLN